MREYHLISQALFHIVAVVPVVLTFECHDLLDTLAVDSLEVLLVHEVVELLLGFFILLFPCLDIIL